MATAKNKTNGKASSPEPTKHRGAAKTEPAHEGNGAPEKPEKNGAKNGKAYRAKDIEVLEGLEAVRRRPSMYIGGIDARGLHHLVWEIVDNAVDEYLAEAADHMSVTLHKDGATVTVTDNGRGIPVDTHPK